MNRIFWALFALVLLGIFILACGSYNNPNSTAPTSNLAKRVFASNSFNGQLQIIDANLDVLSTFFVLVPSQPAQMRTTPDLKLTLVFDAPSSIAVVNNATETNAGTISLPDRSDSFLAKDSAVGFAAVRNASAVEVLDLTNIKISQTVNVATPVQLSLGNTGQKLLVFSDTLPGTVTFIDTATAVTDPNNSATQVSSPLFDHPMFAVFDTGDHNAFVLSCGPECGGTQAMVTKVDMTTAPPTVVSAVNVPAATVGLLTGASLSTLYVAGTNGGGQLTIVDTGAMTAAAPLAIGDGFHWKIALDTHNHLYLGAKTCTQNRCLSTYDISAQTVTVEQDSNGNGLGDVTGFQRITGRDRLYMAQGGEVRIFDTTTALPLPTAQQIDTVGSTQDVVLIDP